jgi:hypothetical protein
MELNAPLDFSSPQQAVWDAHMNPTIMAQAIPGVVIPIDDGQPLARHFRSRQLFQQAAKQFPISANHRSTWKGVETALQYLHINRANIIRC